MLKNFLCKAKKKFYVKIYKKNKDNSLNIARMITKEMQKEIKCWY